MSDNFIAVLCGALLTILTGINNFVLLSGMLLIVKTLLLGVVGGAGGLLGKLIITQIIKFIKTKKPKNEKL